MSQLPPDDVSDIAARLRTRQSELRRHIGDALADTGRENFAEIVGRVRDPGEESVAELVASTNFSLLDRDVNELREIESAVRRMHEGTYGRCSECGRAIARGRLQVYPTASRCVDCARRAERARAGGHDATPSL